MHDRAGLVRGDQGVDRLGVEQIHISGNQGAPPWVRASSAAAASDVSVRRSSAMTVRPRSSRISAAAGTDLTECAGDEDRFHRSVNRRAALAAALRMRSEMYIENTGVTMSSRNRVSLDVLIRH